MSKNNSATGCKVTFNTRVRRPRYSNTWSPPACLRVFSPLLCARISPTATARSVFIARDVCQPPPPLPSSDLSRVPSRALTTRCAAMSSPLTRPPSVVRTGERVSRINDKNKKLRRRACVLTGGSRTSYREGNTSCTGSRRCSLAGSRGWQRCGPGDDHCTYAIAVQRLTSRRARAHHATATTTTIPAQPVVCRDAPLRLPPTDVTTPLQRALLVQQSLLTTISAVLCLRCALAVSSI